LLKTIVTNPASLDIPEVKELITYLVNDSISNSVLSYDFVLLKESLVKAVSAFHTGPFLLALVEVKNSNQIELNQDLVILDGVQDAGNVGNILRTSAAAGFRQIICLPGTACPWSNKVLRAGMGAQAVLEISEDFYTVEDISHLPIPLLSTQLQGKLSLFEMHDLLSSPVAWVFGNEGFGVSKLIQEISQGVRIPQESRVESLNVASAAAICLFETLRVRLHRTA
jgi:TrmH family RNA methyltransferase